MKLLSQLLLFLIAFQTHAMSFSEKLLAPDGSALDRFGTSLAASESYLIIGAPRDDDHGSNSGSVFVYDAETLEFQRKITPTEGSAGDEFGAAVATHGELAIIGARYDDDAGTNAGAAYIYNIVTGTLIQKITASDAQNGDQFGKAVAIHHNRAVITAWLADPSGESSGKAYVVDTQGNELHHLVAFDAQQFDQFGASVDMDAQHIIIGAPFEDQSGIDTGSAYIYSVETGTITNKFIAPNGDAGDVFGTSVAIYLNQVLVGASRANTSVTQSGAAYLFDLEAGELKQTLTSPLAQENDRFGIAVDINEQFILVGSDFANMGSNDTGRADLYRRSDGYHLKSLLPADLARADFFGSALALSHKKAIVSSVQDDDQGTSSGSAYALPLSTPISGLTIAKIETSFRLSWNSLGQERSYRILSSTDLVNWEIIEETYPNTFYEIPYDKNISKCFFKVEEDL